MIEQCFSDALALISRINIYRIFNREPISMAFAVTGNITVADDRPCRAIYQGIPVTECSSPGQAFPAYRGFGLEAACAVQDMMGVNAPYGGNVLLFSIDNVHCMTPVMLTDTLPEFATAD
jgi:hypothetical protein